MKRLWLAAIGYDSEYLEAACIMALVTWGGWLLLPGLDSFGSTKIFRLMSAVMPEHAWGVVYLLLGLMQLMALRHRLAAWRRLTAFLGCIAWLFLGAFSLAANCGSTAGALYLVMATWEGFLYLRIAVHE